MQAERMFKERVQNARLTRRSTVKRTLRVERLEQRNLLAKVFTDFDKWMEAVGDDFVTEDFDRVERTAVSARGVTQIGEFLGVDMCSNCIPPISAGVNAIRAASSSSRYQVDGTQYYRGEADRSGPDFGSPAFSFRRPNGQQLAVDAFAADWKDTTSHSNLTMTVYVDGEPTRTVKFDDRLPGDGDGFLGVKADGEITRVEFDVEGDRNEIFGMDNLRISPKPPVQIPPQISDGTTIYLDFGESFPNGKLTVTNDRMHEDRINGPLGFFGTSHELISLQKTLDRIGDARSVESVAHEVLEAVRRSFAPFDVKVKRVKAASLTQAGTQLNHNTVPPGHRDTYVFVTGAPPASHSNQIVTYSQSGEHSTTFAFADRIADLTTSESLSNALANAAVHATGVSLGLAPSINVKVREGDAMNRSLLRSIPDAYHVPSLFTRADLPTQNVFDDLANTVGLRADHPAYVTGTGGSDDIFIRAKQDGLAEIMVCAYGSPEPGDARTLPINGVCEHREFAPIAGFSYDVNSETGILVEMGAGDDRLFVDAKLDTELIVRGGSGDGDGVVVICRDNDNCNVTYTPDGDRGSGTVAIEAGNRSTVGLTVTETERPLTFDAIHSLKLVTPLNRSQLTVSNPQSIGGAAANRLRIDGSTDDGSLKDRGRNVIGIEFDVILKGGLSHENRGTMLNGSVTSFEIDTQLSAISSTRFETIDDHGTLERITVTTGEGSNSLDVKLPIFDPDDGLFSYLGVEPGNNRVTVRGTPEVRDYQADNVTVIAIYTPDGGMIEKTSKMRIRHVDDLTIYGNDFPNTIDVSLFDGRTVLYGFGGEDKMYGGRGTDHIFGGDGMDVLEGNDGEDFLYGGAERDTLRGGDRVDRLFGGTGKDSLNGGDGDDFLHPGLDSDRDTMIGGEGVDTFTEFSDDILLDLSEGDIHLQGQQRPTRDRSRRR